MRGQAQIIVFVLLLLLSLLLVTSAASWGRTISQQHLDVGRMTAAESFMRQLDAKIQSVSRHGGSERMDYPLTAPIGLADIGLVDTVEISFPTTAAIPTYWINLTAAGSPGLIRETKDGENFRIQLSYPLRCCFAIDLFTDGAQLATPRSVLIERNATRTENIGGTDWTVAVVRLTLE